MKSLIVIVSLLFVVSLAQYTTVGVASDNALTQAQRDSILAKVNAYRASLVSKSVVLTSGKYPLALAPLTWDDNLYNSISAVVSDNCKGYSTSGGYSYGSGSSWSGFTKVQDYDIYAKLLASKIDAKASTVDPDVFTSQPQFILASDKLTSFACATNYCQATDSIYKFVWIRCFFKVPTLSAPLYQISASTPPPTETTDTTATTPPPTETTDTTATTPPPTTTTTTTTTPPPTTTTTTVTTPPPTTTTTTTTTPPPTTTSLPPKPNMGDTSFLNRQYTDVENQSDATLNAALASETAPADSISAANLTQYASNRLSITDRNMIINAHNMARKEIRLGKMMRNDNSAWPAAQQAVRDLAWSEYAEGLALSWAVGRSMSNGHNPNRSVLVGTKNVQFGENICGGGYSTTAANQINSCVAMFYNEGRCSQSISLSSQQSFVFTSQNVDCTKYVGHFSQVVWAKTTHLGCAFYSTSSSNFLVCNYSPAGNYGSSAMYV